MILRINKPKSEKYQYALNARDSRLIRFLGFIGLISTVFLILGYLQFLHISPLLSLFFAPALIIIILYHLIEYVLMSFYPGFDLSRHRQKVSNYWKNTKRVPKVVVFIPASGESIDVVEATLRAASKIDYPYFRVVLLDDSKDAIYEGIAKSFHINYIRRKNIGYFKKAGNMNNALQYVGEFDNVLVLDADFQPRPEILRELVPYTGEDVGIVQSPQHFTLDKHAHARSKIEYGAAFIQRDFYRVTQVARNRFGAAICVGTSALYNIEALKRVGGFEGVGMPKGWSHSEDVHTGLKMLNSYNSSDQQYKIKYVPIELAKGKCPDDHHSLYKQQNRWATGSMQLLVSKKTIRSDRLSLPQRIIYGSNSLYYFYTITLLISPIYLLALSLSSHPSSWAFTLYFIPSLVFKLIIEPYVMRRERTPLSTSLVVISNAYTFLQAAVLLLIRKPLGWEATGTKNIKKSKHFTFYKLSAAIAFLALYIFTLGVLITNENFQIGPSTFIVCIFLVSFVMHSAFLFYALNLGIQNRRRVTDRKLYASLLISFILVAVVFEAYTHHNKYDVVLRDKKIVLAQQDNSAKSSDNIVDGYRRTEGDIKQLFTR